MIGRDRRLVVLIDADNASPKIGDSFFDEIAKIGEGRQVRMRLG